MRDQRLPHPVAEFRLPPGAPDAVESAYGEFRRLAGEWSAARFALRESSEAIEKARQADVRAAADAFAAGKEPPAGSGETKARESEAQLRRRIEALAVALNEAGDRLARSVAAAKSEWLADLENQQTALEDRYRETVGAALQAAMELGRARTAVHWMGAFDLTLALNGRQRGFTGNVAPLPVRLPRGFAGNTRQNVRDLLGVCAHALDPEPVVERVGTRDESVFKVAGRV